MKTRIMIRIVLIAGWCSLMSAHAQPPASSRTSDRIPLTYSGWSERFADLAHQGNLRAAALRDELRSLNPLEHRQTAHLWLGLSGAALVVQRKDAADWSAAVGAGDFVLAELAGVRLNLAEAVVVSSGYKFREAWTNYMRAVKTPEEKRQRLREEIGEVQLRSEQYQSWSRICSQLQGRRVQLLEADRLLFEMAQVEQRSSKPANPDELFQRAQQLLEVRK